MVLVGVLGVSTGAAGLPVRRSTMPPAGQRCAGCNSLEVDLNYPCGDRYRCFNCHDAKALWQTCSLGWCKFKSQPARCKPLPAHAGRTPSTAAQAAVGQHACPACRFAHKCTTLSTLPGTHALEKTSRPAEAMSVVHLLVGFVFIHVEIWIVPWDDWCLLYWVRVVLWRCWGVFAGVLRGPRKTEAKCRRRLLQEHVKTLKAAEHWPRGDAPVVFTGAKDRDLAFKLKPKDRARVQGFEKTLSRMGGNASGVNWELLNRDPVAAANSNGKLIQRAAEFLESIGRTPDTANARPWNADTAAERAFRHSLHTSKAAAFRLL